MYTKKINDGYIVKTVSYDKNLMYCPTGSCGVVFDAHGTNLVSYTTTVINIDNNGFLYCFGTYLRTTIKHIIAFLKEYAPTITYYDAKMCYQNDKVINIFTGEVLDIIDYLHN